MLRTYNSDRSIKTLVENAEELYCESDEMDLAYASRLCEAARSRVAVGTARKP